MTPDFDHPLDRRGTDSVKWDLKPRTADGRDMLPMWVADMDFRVPDAVSEALRNRLDHAVFGYSYIPDAFREAFLAWQQTRHGWKIPADQLVYAPGVMPAVRASIVALTNAGDEVIVQPPVYYPFFDAIRDNGRVMVENPLVRTADSYEMDLEHLRSKITPRTRILLLCSPHNPVGRVWSAAELTAVGEICAAHGITILCDEIHADLIRDGHTFTPLASISPEIAEITITASAPTKTFNIAGLANAFAVVADEKKRSALRLAIERLGTEIPNTLSLVAGTAAYRDGLPWLSALLRYLNGTFAWYEQEVRARFPRLSLTRLEGTYLAWLDFRQVMRETGSGESDVRRALMQKGGLWLSAGAEFGTGGEGFQRMNLACPRDTVQEGLDRLAMALEALE